MKNKLIVLCLVTTVVTSVTGCGCVRRLRDFVCRGARCGGAPAVAAPAPAPILSAPAPLAAQFDPGCSYAGYDPSCAYGGQVVGFPPAYDSGWLPGGPACESCGGGYAFPSGGVPVEGFAPGGSTTDPGPAPAGSGTR